jgi:hypothetical protein
MKGIASCLSVMSFMLFAFTEPPCENTNAIFRTGDYETQAYKAELVQRLKTSNAEDLRYWLTGYLRPADKEYVIVDVHGHDFCAKVAVLVTVGGKLEDIRRTGARGYRGAELVGFKIVIKEEPGIIEFVFGDVQAVVE